MTRDLCPHRTLPPGEPIEVLLEIVDRHLLRDDAAERGELHDRLLHLVHRDTDDESCVPLLTGRDVRADDVTAERLGQIERLLSCSGDAVGVRDLHGQRRADPLCPIECPDAITVLAAPPTWCAQFRRGCRRDRSL